MICARFAGDLAEGPPTVRVTIGFGWFVTVRMCPLYGKDRGPSDLMRHSHDDVCDRHAADMKDGLCNPAEAIVAN